MIDAVVKVGGSAVVVFEAIEVAIDFLVFLVVIDVVVVAVAVVGVVVVAVVVVGIVVVGLFVFVEVVVLVVVVRHFPQVRWHEAAVDLRKQYS